MQHIVANSTCEVEYIMASEAAKENLADPLTKALSVKEFDHHKSKMGIRYCTDWL